MRDQLGSPPPFLKKLWRTRRNKFIYEGGESLPLRQRIKINYI
jgi:hypothetical protein